MILGVVERARKSAAESSALGYIDAVEKQMAINLVNDISIPEGAVTVSTLKSTYKVKVKGEEPKSGWVKIEKGKITDYSLEIGKYVVDYNNGKAKATKNGTVRDQDTIVVDTETEQAPTYTAYSIGNSITLKDASNNETEWYVLEDSDENTETVRLISKWNINPNANSTTTANDLFKTESQGRSSYAIAFNPNKSNVYANSSIKVKLEGDFKAAIENALGITVNSIGIWDYNDMNNLGCTMTWSDNSSPAGIADGATCSSSIYLDSMIKETYSWINAPVAGDSNQEWRIDANYGLTFGGAENYGYFGVRPVITISKSIIK